MKNVLFVCTGNTCRSPLAAALLLRRLEEEHEAGVAVASAGLGAVPGRPATPEAVDAAAEAGADLREHRSQPVTPQLVEASDLILTMEGWQRDEVRQAHPEAAGKIFLLKDFAGGQGEVSDPLGRGLEVYRGTRDELRQAIEAMLPRMRELLGLEKGGERP